MSEWKTWQEKELWIIFIGKFRVIYLRRQNKTAMPFLILLRGCEAFSLSEIRSESLCSTPAESCLIRFQYQWSQDNCHSSSWLKLLRFQGPGAQQERLRRLYDGLRQLRLQLRHQVPRPRRHRGAGGARGWGERGRGKGAHVDKTGRGASVTHRLVNWSERKVIN